MKTGIKELVDKDVYKLIGENAIKLIDSRLLVTIEQLENFFACTLICNTWSFKSTTYGYWVDRCYRNAMTVVGKLNGAHPKGMAIDFDLYKNNLRLDPNFVRQQILDNIKLFPFIRCLEVDINWVHVDVMEETDSVRRTGVNSKTIMLVKPDNTFSIIERKV